MAQVFFPSCKVTAQFQDPSSKLAKYIKEKLNIDPIGCCRTNHQKLTPNDTAIAVCNNCATILAESSQAGKIDFVWQLINNDEAFPFPDYHGETMTVQDCWIASDKPAPQDSVRSLMKKMNINIVELDSNREKSRFCGVNLLSPCTESNAKLAPHRYEGGKADIFTPMSKEEQVEHFKNHCSNITTDKVVCYCKFCTDGINMGGKKGLHILELLFPSDN